MGDEVEGNKLKVAINGLVVGEHFLRVETKPVNSEPNVARRIVTGCTIAVKSW